MQHKKQESIDMILNAIDSLNYELGRSPTNAELHKATGIGTGTISRYLNYMSDIGLIEFEPYHKLAVIHDNNDISEECALVPVVGTIPCGSPEDAEEYIEERIPIPVSVLGTGTFFLLHTKGDSMINAGIDVGDTVLVRQQTTANTGDIVAALTKDGDTTLKRLEWDNNSGRYYLQPENDDYEPIYDEFTIQGVVKKIIKDPV